MFGVDRHAAKVAWTVALVGLALYVTYLIRKTLLIFVLAVFLAYIIAPLVGLIQRHTWRRLPRTASVVEAFVLVIAVGALAAALIAPLASDEAARLAEQLPKLTEKTTLIERVPLPSWLEPYRKRVSSLVQDNLREATLAAIPIAKDLGTRIFLLAGNLLFIVLIPILAFIFVKDGPRIRDALVRAIDSGEQRTALSGLLWQLHEALGRYVRALGLLGLATFTAYALFFSVAEVPYAILLAVIAGVLEILPLVGPLTAAVIALFVAGTSGYEHLLWIAAFVVCYRIFQDYVLAPYLMSGNIGVHPALLIFGLLAGEQLGGIAGIFLSIPIMAALMILAKHARGKEAETLLGGRG